MLFVKCKFVNHELTKEKIRFFLEEISINQKPSELASF